MLHRVHSRRLTVPRYMIAVNGQRLGQLALIRLAYSALAVLLCEHRIVGRLVDTDLVCCSALARRGFSLRHLECFAPRRSCNRTERHRRPCELCNTP